MIWLYRLLFIPALVLSLPYYLIRMFRRGGYREGFGHRFGFIPPIALSDKKRLWIQAVSVGEINAIRPLIEKLHATGEVEIILTTTTSTGYALAKERLSEYCQFVGVFPLDFCLSNALAWRRIRPDIAVLMESELWPEHCHRARKKGCPLLLINARMSDRSFRRYQKWKPFTRWILNKPEHILASSEEEARRYRELGAAADTVQACGNMKFDVPSGTLSAEEEQSLWKSLGFAPAADGSNPLVLLGSSTWPGEEALLLDTLHEAKKAGLHARLLLVPRHAERREDILALLKQQPLRWHQRSSGSSIDPPVHIHLADTTGELSKLTQCADVVFVGKSLPPNEGGQTPIEACAAGKAVVYGPHMSNFRALCQSLTSEQAALQAKDAESVKSQLLALLRDGEKRSELGSAAKQWHAKHQGATEKILSVIRNLL